MSGADIAFIIAGFDSAWVTTCFTAYKVFRMRDKRIRDINYAMHDVEVAKDPFNEEFIIRLQEKNARIQQLERAVPANADISQLLMRVGDLEKENRRLCQEMDIQSRKIGYRAIPPSGKPGDSLREYLERTFPHYSIQEDKPQKPGPYEGNRLMGIEPIE